MICHLGAFDLCAIAPFGPISCRNDRGQCIQLFTEAIKFAHSEEQNVYQTSVQCLLRDFLQFFFQFVLKRASATRTVQRSMDFRLRLLTLNRKDSTERYRQTNYVFCVKIVFPDASPRIWQPQKK